MLDGNEVASLRVQKPEGIANFAAALWPRELTWKACGAGVLAGFVAMTLRAAMQPLLGDAVPFVLAFPAVVLVALRYGAPPAFLTALVCALWAATSLVPPTIQAEHLPMNLGTFVLSAFAIALICGPYRSREAPSTTALSAIAETSLVRWLRAVLWGAALLPIAAFVAAAGWGYQDAFARARIAGLDAANVASQHAGQAFADALKAMERAQSLSEPARASEAELHERLKDLSLGLPAGAALTVITAQGTVLAGSAVYPADRTLNYSNGEGFQQLRQQPRLALYVSEVVKGRQTGRSGFTVSRARLTANGDFDGVIAATLRPEYFQEFYKALAPKGSGNTYTLFRNDGAVITRWPPSTREMPRLTDASPVLTHLQAGAASGAISLTSSFDGERRLVSFVRVPELPLYAVAGLTEQGILATWYRYLQWLAAIVVPTTLVLVYVAWMALQRVRGQQAMVMALEAETARRTQAEGALLHAQKLEALGQLTGGVAHDFNNLLGIVSNNVYLLKHVTKEPAAAGPLAAIGRATASGVKLTRQLLSFARKHALKPETLRLQDWLPATGDLLRTTLGGRTVLSIEVDPDTAPVRVDPSELELALINLAVNAKHAMIDTGRVLLQARNLDAPRAGEPQPGVQIRFTDSGSGIPAETIGRVFEPFFTTKGPGVGSGLGLSQVYGLCVQAGGTARVESVEGHGTTVSLLLPAQAPQLADRIDEEFAAPSRLHGCVLMVEDNDELAAAQEVLLRTAGLDVERVSRADRALSLAESDAAPFDVVLSDVMMPGPFDGIELAFRLHKSRPTLPVILLTGYAHQIEKAADAGFVVLGKPVEPPLLFAEIARALERKRAN